jgi:peptide/nickel transport system permease protein
MTAVTEAPLQEFDDSFRQRLPYKLKVGLVLLSGFVLVAVLAPVLAPFDPTKLVAPPLEPPSSTHLLGTDPLGRDVLSRIIHATRIDLPLSVLVVVLSAAVGTVAGGIAAYRGGFADTILNGLSSLVQSFPTYVLLIAVVFALGPGARSLVVGYIIINWVIYARIVRGEVLRVKGLDYVHAARGSGTSGVRLLFLHIFPNATRQLLVYMSIDIVLAIGTIATFSFFGIGVQAPTAEWGAMVASGAQYLTTDPLPAIFPGFAMIALGLTFALIGDGLDDHLGV